MAYDDILTHVTMLRDAIRTDAYRKAIENVVRPGDRVLDFGCGTGVLSIFAERAGASKVYAVDRSNILGAARRIFADNECKNIELIAGDGFTVELPEQVDVVVSEWMGHFLFAEPMLDPLLRLRDKFLRPGGRIIPSICSLHLAPVTQGHEYETRSFLRNKPYGIDFSAVAEWPFYEAEAYKFDRGDIMPDSTRIATMDMLTLHATPRDLSGTIQCSESALCYGLCGWFDTEIAPGIDFSTGPLAPDTHWLQMYFPFDKPLALERGQTLDVKLRIVQLNNEHDGYEWEAKSLGETRSGDNIVHRAWLASSP